jgi:hypothetical protein
MLFAAELAMLKLRLRHGLAVSMLATLLACAPTIRSTGTGPLTTEQMAQFWEDVEPDERADLFHGVGGPRLQPDPNAVYELLKKDSAGFSAGYDVRDSSGLEWSVKVGDEAQSEVAASRLLWALGYRQPPLYYVPEWRFRHEGRIVREGAGRFRPKLPWLKNVDVWSWHRNPFVDTQPYRGLLALMMFINSTDLKNTNNALYERREDGRTAERWYVVRDLGATFGTTGILNPKRNDITEFEEHGFIDKVDEDGRVEFEYRGRHKELLKELTVADVRWAADRLARVTDPQWGEIFRAGGYDPAGVRRYVAKLKQKIAEARGLEERRERRGE